MSARKRPPPSPPPPSTHSHTYRKLSPSRGYLRDLGPKLLTHHGLWVETLATYDGHISFAPIPPPSQMWEGVKVSSELTASVYLYRKGFFLSEQLYYISYQASG